MQRRRCNALVGGRPVFFTHSKLLPEFSLSDDCLLLLNLVGMCISIF
jgi:hypothetical protein